MRQAATMRALQYNGVILPEYSPDYDMPLVMRQWNITAEAAPQIWPNGQYPL